MRARPEISTTGARLCAGHCTGVDLPADPGDFYKMKADQIAANHEGSPVTTESTETPVEHCPLWPDCGCPGGKMRPECPGRKSREAVRMPSGWWIAPAGIAGVVFWVWIVRIFL